MPRPTSIVTQDTVRRAAVKILQRGERPSAEAIREQLRGGSLRDVHSHLASFWRWLGTLLSAPEIPIELRDAWSRAFTKMKEDAKSKGLLAKSDADERHAAAEAILKEAEMIKRESEGRVKALEEQLVVERQRVDALLGSRRTKTPVKPPAKAPERTSRRATSSNSRKPTKTTKSKYVKRGRK